MSDDVTLGVVVERLDQINRRLDRVLEDHEDRLRRVERWIYAVPPTLLLAASSIFAAITRGGS